MKNTISLLLIVIILYATSSCFPVIAVENYSRNKLSEDLKDVIDNSNEYDIIPVAIWLSDVDDDTRNNRMANALNEAVRNGIFDEEVLNDRLDSIADDNEKIDEYISIKRQIEREIHSEKNQRIVSVLESRYNTNLYYSRYTPLVIGSFPKRDILDLTRWSDLNRIFLYDDSIIGNDYDEKDFEEDSNQYSRTAGSYGVWQDITNITTLRDDLGYTGEGVKIGMVENHIPDFNYAPLGADRIMRVNALFDYQLNEGLLTFHSCGSPYNGSISHANYVLSILTGIVENDYSGIAPEADIYCADYNPQNNHSYIDAFEYLLDENVNVINASISWGNRQSTYDYSSMFLDYITSWDNVIICISSGNNDDNTNSEVRNAGMAYNVITVGNIDDYNTIYTSDDSINNKSCYVTGNNKAYKPDICAPGTRAATYYSPDKLTIANGGTSAASPIVAGICALLMEAKPILKTKIMVLKSAVLSTAINLSNMNNIYSNANIVKPALLKPYGSGMVDAYQAYCIVNNSMYKEDRYPASMIYQKDVTVSQSDINLSKDIYACACWVQDVNNSSGIYYDEQYYTVLNGFDHTLYLYDPDNVLVAKSSYAYDRKQFIRYKPLQSGTFTIKVIMSYINLPMFYPEGAFAYCIK